MTRRWLLYTARMMLDCLLAHACRSFEVPTFFVCGTHQFGWVSACKRTLAQACTGLICQHIALHCAGGGPRAVRQGIGGCAEEEEDFQGAAWWSWLGHHGGVAANRRKRCRAWRGAGATAQELQPVCRCLALRSAGKARGASTGTAHGVCRAFSAAPVLLQCSILGQCVMLHGVTAHELKGN